jgi:hypothetical protein
MKKRQVFKHGYNPSTVVKIHLGPKPEPELCHYPAAKVSSPDDRN